MISMKNLKFLPILLLICIAPATANAHIYTHIFSDDFNRGDDNVVDNGWGEYQANKVDAEASINNYKLYLDGDDGTSQRPCVYHQFDIPPSASEEYIQVNFTYNFAPLPNEVEYDDTNGFQFNMRLGENMDCKADATERFFDLFHAGSAKKPNVSVNGSFGHFTGVSSRSSPAIVNGLVDISILINNIDDVFSYNVTGDVFDIDTGNPSDIKVQNVPYLNNVVVNSTFIKLSNIQTALEIDDFTVNTFPPVVGTCGINAIDNFHYGIVKPGETSDYAQIEIITTGDTDSLVSVSADDWTRSDKSIITIIPSENTRFTTIENLPYASMTTLTDTLKEIGVLSHHYSYTTYWKTHVPIDTTHNEDLFQDMTFDAQCN